MIDYTSIPSHPKQSSPRQAIGWAIISLVTVMSVLGLGALATMHSAHRSAIMASISGLMVVSFWGVVIGAFGKGFRLFQKQKKWMQAFADADNWQYDARRRTISDLAGFPPSLGISPLTTNVRCTVSGYMGDIPFELAYITYLQTVGIIGIALTHVVNRPSWVTVLRIKGSLPPIKNPTLLYDEDATYSYIINPLNALYADDVRALLDSVTDNRT